MPPLLLRISKIESLRGVWIATYLKNTRIITLKIVRGVPISFECKKTITFSIKNLSRTFFSFILISLGEKRMNRKRSNLGFKLYFFDRYVFSLLFVKKWRKQTEKPWTDYIYTFMNMQMHKRLICCFILQIFTLPWQASDIYIFLMKNIMYPYLILHMHYSIGGIFVLLWDKYTTSSAYDHVGWKIYVQLIAYYIFLTLYFV